MTAPVTVVMPAFNAEDTIAASVRSALGALGPQDRLLVRDDGSRDDTLDILHGFSDPRLDVLGGPNVGVARGLQILLDEVDTPLVARLDADDECLPWRFSAGRRAMESTGCDLVFGSTIGMTDRLPVSPKGPAFALSRSSLPLHLLMTNPLVHSTMLGRTDVVREHGGYRLSAAEDYDLWLRLAAAGVPMMRTLLPVLRFRYSSGQVTAKPEWIDRLHRDGELRSSYEALCARILGREAIWFPSLIEKWHGRPGDADALREFTALVERAARRLPPGARAFFELRLARLGLR